MVRLQGKVGTLPKDKMAGKFVTEWATVLTGSGKDIKEIDAAPGLSALLAVKDAEELVRPCWVTVRYLGEDLAYKCPCSPLLLTAKCFARDQDDQPTHVALQRRHVVRH